MMDLAFPVSDGNHTECGMSMREWYAGQALRAIIQCDGAQFMGREEYQRRHAETAFAYADAMIAEQEKRTGH